MVTEEMMEERINYRYKVESLDILFQNGDIENIKPGMVTHLYIEMDYDNLYFPIINLSVVLKDIIYDKINKENETVKFRVKVNKYLYDKDNEFITYQSYINDTFISFLDKKKIVTDFDSIDHKEAIEPSDIPTNRANNRNFYLFKDTVIDCKKILNLSIESAVMTDLLIYMFNECNIQKMLMSKLDNNTSLSNFLIPSGNLMECIKFLNETKGFYTKGFMMFFDVDTGYFLDKNYKCTAWRPNEVRMTHMHVAIQRSKASQLTGMFTDDDRKSHHIFTNCDRIEVINENILNDQLQGNEITVVNNKAGSVNNIREDTSQIGSPNKNVLVSKENNSYMIKEMQERLKENECIITLSFLGLDLECLTPNKEILITYEDSELNKKFGGGYRLCKYTATLKKAGEELIGPVETFCKKQK